jgi:hypothetical protein
MSKKDDKIHNMAACMLSILDSLRFHDNEQLELGDETLSEMMFRKMKGYGIDLNEELGFDHLKPVKKENMKKTIQDMAEGIGIPQEAIDHVFEPISELEDFPVGDIATFNEFINAPEGTEFIVVSIKDGESIRDVSQYVPTEIEIKEGGTCGRFKDPGNDNFEVERVPVTWLYWSGEEGDPETPFQDIDDKMEKVGAYIGRWRYTVYKVKL